MASNHTYEEPNPCYGVCRDALKWTARKVPVVTGEIGEEDRVVVLVTGTGLKTPQVVGYEATGSLVEIEADADALLDQLGVTA